MSDYKETVFVLTPKDCPFCGGKLSMQYDHHGNWYEHTNKFKVRCIDAMVQLMDDDDIDLWNTRA